MAESRLFPLYFHEQISLWLGSSLHSGAVACWAQGSNIGDSQNEEKSQVLRSHLSSLERLSKSDYEIH